MKRKTVCFTLVVLFAFCSMANADTLTTYDITNYVQGGSILSQYKNAPSNSTTTLSYDRSEKAPIATAETGDFGSVYVTGKTNLIFTTAAMGLNLTWNELASISWSEKFVEGDDYNQNADAYWIIEGYKSGYATSDGKVNTGYSKTSEPGLDGFTNYTIDLSNKTGSTNLTSIAFSTNSAYSGYELYLDWVMFSLTNGDQYLFNLNHPDGVSASVPEPATMLIFGLGLVGAAPLAYRRYRRRNK